MVGGRYLEKKDVVCECALFRISGRSRWCAVPSNFTNDHIMLPSRSRLIALCPACGAVLPPLRGFVSAARKCDSGKVRLSPDRVVVMHKTSRLEFERKRNTHLSESQLHTEVSVGRDIFDRLGRVLCLSRMRIHV